MVLPCCIARCRVRARSGAPLVVCAVATGYQLWTWPPLGTGAAISCPVVPGVWVIWGSWWHEKHRIDASPARAALIRSMPPKVQTTSPKNGKNGLFWVRWSAIWANPETRQTRPPTTATFPRRTADKSPPQQHDMSILQVASRHLQHQLSRTNKPKSHHKTNTFHPITLVSYNPEPSEPTHMESTAGSTSTPHPEPAQAAQATTKPRDSRGIPGQGAETAGFEPARGYAPLPP